MVNMIFNGVLYIMLCHQRVFAPHWACCENTANGMLWEIVCNTLHLRPVDKITGPWFNIKMSSYQYRKFHCGDKTILRPSYLHNGISYTGKMTS